LKKEEDWSITPPQTLSSTGIFPNFETMIPKAGFIPYGVNISFWSDRAQKSRWIAIPNNGSLNTAEEKIVNGGDDNWVFPEGTIFIKHFDLAMDERTPNKTIKLETRFMVVGPDQTVKGFTYKWNAAQTDAVLLTEGQNQDFSIIDEDGTSYTQRWNYPSRGACLSCHSPAAGYVLGFNTPQLNKDILYPSSGLEDNQLRALNFLGAFSNPLNEAQIENMNKWHPLTDASIDTADRLSMYLNVNCSYCHRPNGQFAGLDLRFNRPLESLVDLETKSNSSPEGSVVIMAGHPDSSQMWVRTNAIDDNLMPPLGRKLVDEDFVDMLGAWIEGLEENNGGVIDPGGSGDLIAYWPFDGGDQSDLAGSYEDKVSFTGRIKRSTEGRLDKAFKVEGEDASFTIAGSTEAPFKNAAQDYSISFWLKVIPKDARGRNGSSTTTLPSINPSNQQTNTSSGSTYSSNDGGVTEVWRHIVVRSVSNSLDFYEDGDNADSPEDWGLQIDQGQNSLYFSPSGNHEGFYIDEMRLFNYRIGTQKIQELADGIGDPILPCNVGTLSQEFWYDLSTTTDLASIPLEEAADEVKEITTFASGENIGDAYGSRISGYLCPPETGEYTFWIASNDNGQLSLSTDESPDNKQVIAFVSNFTKFEEWDKYEEQQSAPVYLEQGKRYYIEAMMKEGLGSDHLSVGWQLPSGTLELPMSAENMSPYVTTSVAVQSLPGLDMLSPVDVSQWNVYPNPTDGNLTISMLTDLQQSGSLSLMNLQGQEIMSRTVSESTTLDLSTLSPGIYLLVLEKGGSRQVQKIFRQ
ncbi:MAG: T9SS type A sorting domain-containing protein, partial [Bacteroidota bacterium]